MHTYELEAGRSIVRDGVPFCCIGGSKRDGAPFIDPRDLDAFARLCVAAPALLEALHAAEVMSRLPGGLTVAEHAELGTRCREAIALVPADYLGRI